MSESLTGSTAGDSVISPSDYTVRRLGWCSWSHRRTVSRSLCATARTSAASFAEAVPARFVVADVPLPSESVQQIYRCGVESNREAKRENGPLMRAQPGRPESLGREGEYRKLECAVIGYAEFPVRTEILDGGVLQIAINDGEKIGDLLLRRLVLYDPAAVQPIPQAHSHFPRA